MINKILDDLIQEAIENPDWKAESALRCAKKELLEKIDFCGKWISVRDELPQDRKCVLCLCEGNIRMVLRLHFWKGVWYKDESHSYFLTFVTHWMPLPEPPKEEE